MIINCKQQLPTTQLISLSIYYLLYMHAITHAHLVRISRFFLVFILCFPLVLGFDLFYLSIQWPTAYCNSIYVPCTRIPHQFIIHGLWPANYGNVVIPSPPVIHAFNLSEVCIIYACNLYMF
jgi:hypothetical protein